jgi:hypothetical protein
MGFVKNENRSRVEDELIKCAKLLDTVAEGDEDLGVVVDLGILRR